jgi:hypothetical protein
MDPTELVQRLSAIPARVAGSDAERRAARLLARELRTIGRRPRVQTLWVRPSWPPVLALVAVLSVMGTIVSVDAPEVGVGLCAAAFLAFVADLAGLPLLRRLTFERATQNVVSVDTREAPVRLIVTASVDTPRAGPLTHGRAARLAARLRRWLGPVALGGYGVVALALLAATLLAGLRAGGAEGDVMGAIQLVPVAVLIAAIGVALDTWTGEVGPGANANASACAVAVALVAALDRTPPPRLAVDLVLAGAGEAQALGMRRWIAAQRRAGLAPTEVAVLHIGACGDGDPVWWVRDGAVVPLGAHPQLLGVAERAAAADPALGARPVQSRRMTGARAARARGWPSLAIGAMDADGIAPRVGTRGDVPEAIDPDAMDRTLAFALAVVAGLDRELARVHGPGDAATA